MATLLTDGAGPLAFQAFQRRQEDAAASLGFSASLDRLSGTLRVLSANREEGFELLRLALTQPRFDADMVEQRRAQIVAALNQADQRPASVASRTLMATEFAGHPYANDLDGTPDDLKTLTPQKLKQRAAQLLLRSGLIVAAVGDIDEAELGRLLDRAFGSLPAGTPPRAAARMAAADQAAHRRRRAVGAAEHGADGAARHRPRRSRLVRRARAQSHPGRRRPAVAAVQRGARKARPGLRRLEQPARLPHGQRFW